MCGVQRSGVQRRAAEPSSTRHDTTRHDTTRHDTTPHDTTRHHTTPHDTTRYTVSEWAQSLFREFLAGSFAASAHLDPASRCYQPLAFFFPFLSSSSSFFFLSFPSFSFLHLIYCGLCWVCSNPLFEQAFRFPSCSNCYSGLVPRDAAAQQVQDQQVHRRAQPCVCLPAYQ